MDELVANRVIALFALFILTLITGMGPVIFFYYFSCKQRRAGQVDGHAKDQKPLSSVTTLQVLMFFGGGVLLATCFVHLIPETNESFEKYIHSHELDNETSSAANPTPHLGDHSHKHDVPWIELSICGGFFLIYFLEETLFHFVGHDHHDHAKSLQERPIFQPAQCDCIQQSANYGSVDTSNATAMARSEGNIASLNENVHNSTQQIVRQNPEVVAISPSKFFGVSRLTWAKFFHGLLTIMAFSVHSIFDGIVIGLQQTKREIWTVFLAIFFHKMVVSFAIGLDLYEKSKHFLLTAVNMIFFSLMSPIGILIAILTSGQVSSEPSLVMIILSAICTGTIIYIVFFEILQRERVSSVSGLAQFFIVLIGFTLMTCVTLFVSEE